MGDSLVPKIVGAIADAKGVEPDELDFELYEYIDLDVVERLATHGTASWTLSFELPDHSVTVTSDGAVLVDGIEKRTSDVATHKTR